MMPDNNLEEIKKLLVENQRLLLENNHLLHRMRRTAFFGTIFRVIWFLVVISVPVIIYFNYIQPNLGTIKEKINNFEQISSDNTMIKDFVESWKSKP